MAIYTKISSKHIRLIEKKYNLGKIIHFKGIKKGIENTNYLLRTKNKKFILVDDLLATGGTAAAAIELLKKSGGSVSCFLALIELTFLNGKKKIDDPVETLIRY